MFDAYLSLCVDFTLYVRAALIYFILDNYADFYDSGLRAISNHLYQKHVSELSQMSRKLLHRVEYRTCFTGVPGSGNIQGTQQ